MVDHLEFRLRRRLMRAAANERVSLNCVINPRVLLRRCTYAGRPFGDEVFVQAVSERFGRHWQRGRPKKERAEAAADAAQLALFGEEM